MFSYCLVAEFRTIRKNWGLETMTILAFDGSSRSVLDFELERINLLSSKRSAKCDIVYWPSAAFSIGMGLIVVGWYLAKNRNSRGVEGDRL